MGSRSYGFVVGNGDGGGSSIRDEEFNEEDIWAFGREIKEINSPTPKFRRPREPPTFSTLRRIPTASRMIPRSNSSSSSSSNLVEPIVLQQSAPVNIPDWSKIYRKNLNNKGSMINSSSSSWVDGDGDGDAISDHVYRNYDFERDYNGVGDDDDEEDEWLPPHEFIAKRLASSQISSFSVCEGVGRTLKGRDLTKVRNAVLTKTGFLQ